MSNRWTGCTVVCIASGPSLTAEDCNQVEASGLPSIAVNTSWKLARFADVIYAGDTDWWKHNLDDINIPAELWTCRENAAKRFGLQWHQARGPYNSGLRAIQLAIGFDAKRILLLGYDCTIKNGVHWHGPHTDTNNPDMNRCSIWRRQFAQLNTLGSEVVNCSRETALGCFPRKDLEQALEEVFA